MKVETKELSREEINFLKSEKVVSVSCTVVQSRGTVVGTRKIVKAGTILPTNNNQAKGILLEDVDVTAGDAPAAMMIGGFVLEARLPEVPDSAAKTALKEIKFM